VKAARCNYRGNTLILETIFETEDGEVALIDSMPVKEQTVQVDLIRLAREIKGFVSMQTELVLRFGYGKSVPWYRVIPRTALLPFLWSQIP
jgi:hypothetical protein